MGARGAIAGIGAMGATGVGAAIGAAIGAGAGAGGVGGAGGAVCANKREAAQNQPPIVVKLR
ncbi:MAG TPA: hypothetical protein VMB03_03525 [Bryobacteraceae bacterium]|nr:hypothetical protein [Bryobacteraceae bacterium]